MIFDAHLDLAMNAVEWNRDLTRPLDEIRRTEAHLKDKPDRGRGTVSLPEMRNAGVGMCVATLIARVEMNAWSPVAGWRSQAQAWAITEAQLAWYRAMEEAGEMRMVRSRGDLPGMTKADSGTRHSSFAIPFLLSLEGADSLITTAHLERRYAGGLRAIGPAHYGPGVYANGTDATGGFNSRGRELLAEIERLGMILDATHLCDDCFWEMLDRFRGPVWASHHNARTLVPHNRQLSDEMFRALVQRGAVVGVALDAWMIVPGWERRKTTPQSAGVTLGHLADHIDHFCQLAGNAQHVGIGTDQTPLDLDTIADIRKLEDILAARGYTAADIAGIFSGNFLGFLRGSLPA
jgi:membrane dipeptidase